MQQIIGCVLIIKGNYKQCRGRCAVVTYSYHVREVQVLAPCCHVSHPCESCCILMSHYSSTHLKVSYNNLVQSYESTKLAQRRFSAEDYNPGSSLPPRHRNSSVKRTLTHSELHALSLHEMMVRRRVTNRQWTLP